MASKNNLAYKLTILFTVMHFGSSQFHVPLAPQPRFGFRIFSSLFSGFGGDSCRTQSGESGTCVDFSQCSSTGGRASGSCGFGFKTCCLSAASVIMSTVPIRTTTSTTTEATTQPSIIGHLIKDNPSDLSDALTIERISSDYCQIRVDFISFKLEKVNNNGDCMNGRWTCAGQSDNTVPSLCGMNSGQHLYLNFKTDGTPITMILNTMSKDSFWNIKTTQIACNDVKNLAPNGCLQFFTDKIGNVKSFNYEPIQDKTSTENYQPNNLDYKVCIDLPSTTFKMIKWTPDTQSSLFHFTVSFDTKTLQSFLGTPEGSFKDVECATDYIEIQEGVYDDLLMANKFCGVGFPESVISKIIPFTLNVITDAEEKTDMGNVGFSLNFELMI